MLQTGFTLVELLIVVAIIAILAAIAVPNLLDAQTRAKVAATRNDQRALDVALEAYRVDQAAYPPGPNPQANPGADTETWRLTTPVAYITAVPQDLFFAPQPFGQLGGPFGIGGSFMHYLNDPIISEQWLLWSYGPDQDMEFVQVDYDPTNGTLSDGDLYRIGVVR